MMMTASPDLNALAAFIHTLRPDWDTSGIVAALRRCDDEDLSELAIVAIRAARLESNRTPAVIPMQGPHRQPEPGSSPRDRDAARAIPGDPRTDGRARCPIHGRHELAPPFCRACRSEELAGTRAKPVPVPDEEPAVPDHRMRAAGEGTR